MKDEEEDKDNAEEEATEPKGYRVGPIVEFGSGLLENARKALMGRGRTIEEAIKEAEGKK